MTICAVNLATAVPLAPAGLGAFELVAVKLLGVLGVDATAALAMTLIVHAVIFFPVVVVGLFALWRTNLPLFARPAPAIAGEPSPEPSR